MMDFQSNYLWQLRSKSHLVRTAESWTETKPPSTRNDLVTLLSSECHICNSQSGGHMERMKGGNARSIPRSVSLSLSHPINYIWRPGQRTRLGGIFSQAGAEGRTSSASWHMQCMSMLLFLGNLRCSEVGLNRFHIFTKVSSGCCSMLLEAWPCQAVPPS